MHAAHCATFIDPVFIISHDTLHKFSTVFDVSFHSKFGVHSQIQNAQNDQNGISKEWL